MSSGNLRINGIDLTKLTDVQLKQLCLKYQIITTSEIQQMDRNKSSTFTGEEVMNSLVRVGKSGGNDGLENNISQNSDENVRWFVAVPC